MFIERFKQVLEMENLSKVAAVCKSLVRVLFVLLNNIYCIPTYVLWMVLFAPLRKCNPDLYWKIEGQFFHGLLAMVAMWSWSAGYDIVEQGDDIQTCLEERTLVIANHQSTADVPLLMATFNAKPNVLPNLMWIMDRIFKYTNFGIVSIIHQDFFIVSGKEKRLESLEGLRRHLYESYIPRGRKWMVLFPEGGFLRKRRETSQRYALKNNLPVLQHVSLPRVGALQTIIDVVGPVESASVRQSEKKSDILNSIENDVMAKVTSDPAEILAALQTSSEGNTSGKLNWVLDITIAYPEGKPLDLSDIITGYRKPCKTFMFYRLFRCSEVPQEHDAMAHWLYDRFAEKEKLLEAFYRTGEFPSQEFCSHPKPPQEVQQDGFRFFVLHVLFITSTILHLRLLSYAASFVW
ncbi:acyl-CoA:lysophosphatidylglycerol acyltransferase 1-like [Schistocerca nitens]|uniref:acyl-CoA:lysophosphatidylglycerol acyltransferase 1-like n=1 Tax=Schistocerca nitens TaxID=7011 RepID=UPI00211739BF|nr:acyl-CoA:lysophosphatidylglycerol acyltransferase 1-like [Schistocerca nitens]XP_049795535.1 acyl-CoA:lysophosphatidylglycerol acyltransferase 1-like [Schistocerca nitens]XP_049795536.1 acyl-CoA:lysophosphatidylglycerol acyltransferase 1-like [Schistocerca nitens]